MWTYAGRDPAFAAQLVDADAAWEREIRAVLERVRDDGLLLADVDLDSEAAVLARLVDGLGLRAWLSGALGATARRRLVAPPGDARRARARVLRRMPRRGRVSGRAHGHRRRHARDRLRRLRRPTS